MNQFDAFKILGLSGAITAEITKQAYRKACSKYHPDRNPAGTEIMKMVNVAFATIKNYIGEAGIDSTVAAYGEEVAKALNEISPFNLTIEICGSWVWISGDTKEFKTQLKDAGFKWAPKKKMWYFKPSDAKRSRSFGSFSMDDIRSKYGTKEVRPNLQKKLKKSA